MKKVQQGFTLIELMIVIAIIGILAAIALPAYQDYTVKAKLQEPVSMSSPFRTAMGIACSEGTLGASLTDDDMGHSGTAANYSGKYTESIDWSSASVSAGVVTIVLGQIGSTVDSGDTMTYSGACDISGMSWTVGVSGTIPSRFKPKT